MKPFTDILNSTLAKFTTDLNFVGMSSVSLNEYANVSCTLHEEEGASPLLTLMTNNVSASFSVTACHSVNGAMPPFQTQFAARVLKECSKTFKRYGRDMMKKIYENGSEDRIFFYLDQWKRQQGISATFCNSNIWCF